VPPPAEKPLEPGLVPDIILESRIEDILEYLTYILMGQRLYEIFGLSRLAEFSARFVHLEESNQKLKEVDKKTRLEYFRVRHELIDRNMRELFAARLLYAS
jgi:F0F1-type ATP synthase gamma subunit